ncbi:MAG: GTPase HflX [Deltaproteobacteria bacterium]|nr:GTPase HflX [Deltaproteobacteria bacterium]MBW2396542.1 GTPase HflX [Deltaproteobacteria bacterium]
MAGWKTLSYPLRDFPQQPSRGNSIRVFGNTHGLKANQVKRLERLGRRSVPADRLVSQELARELTELSREIRRQTGVLVDRRGDVTHVMVGAPTSIEMPEWGRMRAGSGRLRGLRCIHTHLGSEGLTRDDLTDLAVLRFDAMISIQAQQDGLPGLAYTAALMPENDEGTGIQELDPAVPARLDLDFQDWIRALEEELARTSQTRTVGDGERAILVVVTAGRSSEDTDYSTEELCELARSAGVEVIDVMVQNRGRPDPKTVVGAGKLQDLLIRCFQSDVDLVIFDDNLTAAQARNLADRLELRVIDRTQLILDIFAQHAKTRDGKLQVELAQLKYVLPRLTQRDTSLSRLGGGIGGRGPGEQKLEIDRRRVRERVARLERDLKSLQRQREHRRSRRTRRGLPVLSIVGYTNAGKSTLLRALTQKDVHIEDKMFATLDPASRRLRFPRDQEVIITDTVGFIRDLPPDLVAAFKATLEELREAKLFLHVVDASNPDIERHMKAVRGILADIGLDKTPELLIFNKIDRLPAGDGAQLATKYDAVPISALHRTGLAELLEQAEEIMAVPIAVELDEPYMARGGKR